MTEFLQILIKRFQEHVQPFRAQLTESFCLLLEDFVGYVFEFQVQLLVHAFDFCFLVVQPFFQCFLFSTGDSKALLEGCNLFCLPGSALLFALQKFQIVGLLHFHLSPQNTAFP